MGSGRGLTSLLGSYYKAHFWEKVELDGGLDRSPVFGQADDRRETGLSARRRY